VGGLYHLYERAASKVVDESALVDRQQLLVRLAARGLTATPAAWHSS
jgi:hypothetical protein